MANDSGQDEPNGSDTAAGGGSTRVEASPDDTDLDSDDEALLEVLGLSSLDALGEGDAIDDDVEVERDDPFGAIGKCRQIPLTPLGIPDLTPSQIECAMVGVAADAADTDLPSIYESEGVVVFPPTLSVPAATMRRITDELVWVKPAGVCAGGVVCERGGGGGEGADRTYETIKVLKKVERAEALAAAIATTPGGETKSQCISDHEDEEEGGGDGGKVGDENVHNGTVMVEEQRRVLTRLENFVTPDNLAWYHLCNIYLARLVSALVGEEMVLYKEKLNLKPPGGAGFAPHLDTPSLRVALGDGGPQEFVTVMVAIDDMTTKNGCLRVARGAWSESSHVNVVPPKEDGNPDGDGRAGAILPEVVSSSSLNFDDLVCKGGTVAAFNGFVPHRSSPNGSPFPRRAVFLTYNPKREGFFRDSYYGRMKELREGYRSREHGVLGAGNGGGGATGAMSDDERLEMEALASIPRI